MIKLFSNLKIIYFLSTLLASKSINDLDIPSENPMIGKN